MTTSTNAVAKVTPMVPLVEALAGDLNELALQPRRHWLRKREARLPYVVDLRKKMATGIAKPFYMLLALAFTDLDDGIPVSLVVQPFEAIIALLRERAGHMARKSGLPFAVRLNGVMSKETRSEGRMNLLQLAVAANPNDMDARVRLRAASREYRAMLDELDGLLDEQYACDVMTERSA